MTPKDFAKAFYEEKEGLLDLYFNRKAIPYSDVIREPYVVGLIKDINLDPDKKEILSKIVDGVLRDALYGILLGLEGCRSIGNEMQQMYTVCDEEGNKLTGELDNHAYEYFHGKGDVSSINQ